MLSVILSILLLLATVSHLSYLIPSLTSREFPTKVQLNVLFKQIMITPQLKQINIPPGQQILLKNITWLDFENILEELGENRASRLSYEHETLEIMTSLSEHEDDKEILSDLIKAFLEEQEI